MLRTSISQWKKLQELTTISPEEIIEITAYQGKDVEELAEFLENHFNGVLLEFAVTYLDEVLSSMPQNILPSRQEMANFIRKLQENSLDQQDIRDRVVAHFQDRINQE